MQSRESSTNAAESAAAQPGIAPSVAPGKVSRVEANAGAGPSGASGSAGTSGEREARGEGDAGPQAMGDWHAGEMLGAMGLGADGAELPPGAAQLVEQARQGGAPLDEALRPRLEATLGTSLEHVRVHTDAAADKAARAVGARAFALGEDVFFRAGAYDPGSQEGQKLIAHEIAHTVQAGGAAGPSGAMTVSDPAEAAERAADQFADGFTSSPAASQAAPGAAASSGEAGTSAERPKPRPAARRGGGKISRVPDEKGARAGRYTYSPMVGWIDWSHADPTLTLDLIAKVQRASDALAAAGPGRLPSAGSVTTQAMTSRAAGLVLSSAQVELKLKRALSSTEVLSVALSVFKSLSIAFETQQEWTDLIGRSSFAQEDLPSNQIAFYMAARGFSRADIMRITGGLSPDDSVAEFQRSHDFTRNTTFQPMLSGGGRGSWPAELSTIHDAGAKALYETQGIHVTQGTSGFSFSPLYRVVGRLGETDLFVTSVGGTSFTEADDLQVRPTFRFHAATHGAYGDTTDVQVEPARPSDEALLRRSGIAWPLYAPRNVLRGMPE